MTITLLFYSLVALYVAWIWVDYFRLIDLYHKESLAYFVLAFVLGCASTSLVFGLNILFFDKSGFELNGHFVNDFFYSFLRIGMLEELAKLIPLVLFMLFFKKKLKEPIDYIAIACTGALGFSAIENILYFTSSGYELIISRSILATIGHMVDTALLAYGIVLYRFSKHIGKWPIVLLFFVLAALSHGIYDFWLLYEETKGLLGVLLTVFFFLITISLYATILNNALNNSSFFTYKRVIDSHKVTNRLVFYYAGVFFLQFAFIAYHEHIGSAMLHLVGSLYTVGVIIAVITIRLGRFKLIKEKWFPLKLELPFTLVNTDVFGTNRRNRFQVKGDPYNEVYLNYFYDDYAMIQPLSKRNTQLGRDRLIYIEKKIFLKHDLSYYVIRLYQTDAESPFEYYLIKPKMNGTTLIQKKHPIVALFYLDSLKTENYAHLSIKDFNFIEWGAVKPVHTELFKKSDNLIM